MFAITANKNTWQDAENLDDTHGYTSYIWIPEETLTYGMYKLVLSASGRLRARLVFYELCKMFAQF